MLGLLTTMLPESAVWQANPNVVMDYLHVTSGSVSIWQNRVSNQSSYVQGTLADRPLALTDGVYFNNQFMSGTVNYSNVQDAVWMFVTKNQTAASCNLLETNNLTTFSTNRVSIWYKSDATLRLAASNNAPVVDVLAASVDWTITNRFICVHKRSTGEVIVFVNGQKNTATCNVGGTLQSSTYTTFGGRLSQIKSVGYYKAHVAIFNANFTDDQLLCFDEVLKSWS